MSERDEITADEAAADALREKSLDRVAKAIYGSHVIAARDSVDALDFNLAEIFPLTCRLLKESETAQVLIFCSFLEDRFKEAWRCNLKHMNSEARKTLFGMSGPLSTYNMQLTMAFHLGWMMPRTYKAASAFRRIRNEFGHQAFKVSFAEPEIVKLFQQADVGMKQFLPKLRLMIAEDAELRPHLHSDNELPDSNYRLCAFVQLAGLMFMEMLVFPRAERHRVHPEDLLAQYDQVPRIVKNVQLECTKALIQCLLKPAGSTIKI